MLFVFAGLFMFFAPVDTGTTLTVERALTREGIHGGMEYAVTGYLTGRPDRKYQMTLTDADMNQLRADRFLSEPPAPGAKLPTFNEGGTKLRVTNRQVLEERRRKRNKNFRTIGTAILMIIGGLGIIGFWGKASITEAVRTWSPRKVDPAILSTILRVFLWAVGYGALAVGTIYFVRSALESSKRPVEQGVLMVAKAEGFDGAGFPVSGPLVDDRTVELSLVLEAADVHTLREENRVTDEPAVGDLIPIHYSDGRALSYFSPWEAFPYGRDPDSWGNMTLGLRLLLLGAGCIAIRRWTKPEVIMGAEGQRLLRSWEKRGGD